MNISRTVLEESRIPKKYYSTSIENREVNKEALTRVVKFLTAIDKNEDLGMGLLFVGPNGSGKTLMLTVVAKELILLGRDCMYTTMSELIDLSFNRPSDISYADVLRVKHLCVDNVWMPNSSAVTNVLKHLLTERKDNLLSTYIATDLEVGDFVEHYPNSVVLYCEEQLFQINLQRV